MKKKKTKKERKKKHFEIGDGPEARVSARYGTLTFTISSSNQPLTAKLTKYSFEGMHYQHK